jgi:hypothetical protein
MLLAVRTSSSRRIAGWTFLRSKRVRAELRKAGTFILAFLIELNKPIQKGGRSFVRRREDTGAWQE